MKLIAIAAIGQKRELGKNNNLIWPIPEDLKRFMITTGRYPLIMGRKTFESIGKPLPNRPNIVISKSMKKTKGVMLAVDVNDAIEIARSLHCEKCFVIGGAVVYGQFINQNLIDELLLTQIEATDPEADTIFPLFMRDYQKVMDLPQETEDGLKYSFTKWVKKPGV